MKRVSNRNEKPTFVKPLLREINNHSNGGFMLFVFDEDGMPVVHSHYDDATKALALQQFVGNWVNAVEALNIEATLDLMKEELKDVEEDEEDEGDVEL
tara:strand:+ start:526 stop:819 length:294 start_codon:yes stop_codon:yes gene_type:complete